MVSATSVFNFCANQQKEWQKVSEKYYIWAFWCSYFGLYGIDYVGFGCKDVSVLLALSHDVIHPRRGRPSELGKLHWEKFHCNCLPNKVVKICVPHSIYMAFPISRHSEENLCENSICCTTQQSVGEKKEGQVFCVKTTESRRRIKILVKITKKEHAKLHQMLISEKLSNLT